jgi:hypothetical protein
VVIGAKTAVSAAVTASTMKMSPASAVGVAGP